MNTIRITTKNRNQIKSKINTKQSKKRKKKQQDFKMKYENQ